MNKKVVADVPMLREELLFEEFKKTRPEEQRTWANWVAHVLNEKEEGRIEQHHVEKLVNPMTFVEECMKDFSNYCVTEEDVPPISPLLPIGL